MGNINPYSVLLPKAGELNALYQEQETIKKLLEDLLKSVDGFGTRGEMRIHEINMLKQVLEWIAVRERQ